MHPGSGVVMASPGSKFAQARVTTRVVINNLSAAGSNIEPRTDFPPQCLARYPSSYT
jgi:hypothetical protein